MTAYANRRLAGAAAPRFNLLTMLEVYHQRRALARLDDAALADIGLTRAEARLEARRPFWDLGCR